MDIGQQSDGGPRIDGPESEVPSSEQETSASESGADVPEAGASGPEAGASGPEPPSGPTEPGAGAPKPKAPDSKPVAGIPGSGGTSSGPIVEIDEGASAGLAQMVATLLKPAIERNPRAAAKIRGSLALRASDHDAGVTLGFEHDRVKVTGSLLEEASVVIEAPLMTLGTLAQGGHAIRALWRREVRVRRGLRHPLLLIRVRRLLKNG